MRYNQLGRTGLFVSELCLGTMTFGGAQDTGIWQHIGKLEAGPGLTHYPPRAPSALLPGVGVP